ncbi:hypothetical protein B9G69_015015 [Bdellovibrio sp. SKB1291214]|uniref:hypothetical protein n=1 Tax=Bdellovibrio sp. SKB1291214 TaxID=1732569 RepID=UPI000B518FB0|nr:hypothetical protein [Bdellovibrio sp. SKB1291214]UYL08351.1 hypothetical protein B9G69_015015 [Bdellovibrio sp. SKB1291214]
MLKVWITFLISTAFPLITNASALDCPVSDKHCDFYRCMEEQQPCGKRGYWKDFGSPYCELFVRDEKKFSPDSQIWLQDVRLCLQTRLRESVEGLQCGDIKEKAIDDHVSCYVDTGFCQLTFREQFKIMWYLKGALRDYRTWREAELLRRACQRP